MNSRRESRDKQNTTVTTKSNTVNIMQKKHRVRGTRTQGASAPAWAPAWAEVQQSLAQTAVLGNTICSKRSIRVFVSASSCL